MRSDSLALNRKTIPLMIIICLFFAGQQVVAQESDPALVPTVSVSDADLQSLESDYQEKVEAWRQTLGQIFQTRIRYFNSTRDDSEDLRDDWDKLKTQSQTQKGEVVAAAKKLLDVQDKPSLELVLLLAREQEALYRKGRFFESYRMGKKMIAAHPIEQIEMVTAMAAIKVNDFDFAKKFYDENGEMLANIEAEYTTLFTVIDQLSENFEREQELRKADAKADLPRVAIKTNRGEILIELFEDQAPNTVANFISLTEQKYYDGNFFHWVANGLVAETGIYSSIRTSVDCDYAIEDEFEHPDARHHFRGSIGLAKTDTPNSGNERIFICLQPMPILEGRNTVFGRVIEGDDVLDQLTHTHERNEEGEHELIPEVRPDYIISATVTRKRPDSDYEVKKIPRPKEPSN